jgi:hypothetical protein
MGYGNERARLRGGTTVMGTEGGGGQWSKLHCGTMHTPVGH